MNLYEQRLRKIGSEITLRQVEYLAEQAREAGATYDLARALLATWNFETARPGASAPVLRTLIIAGLRKEAIELVNSYEFSGKTGCLMRLKQLFPEDIDRNEMQH